MSHNHSCSCEHPNVKFCSHCKTVYCKDCNQEWTAKTNWTYTYTYPYSGNQTGVQSGFVWKQQDNTLDDGHSATVSNKHEHK